MEADYLMLVNFIEENWAAFEGFYGSRENAEAALDAIMRDHNITPD